MRWHDAQPMILATPAPKASATGAVRLNDAGQPVQRFRKELIRAGKYVKAADGLAFEATPATLRHWADTAAAYLSAGNRIPVPASHTDDPEKNRGWVVEMWVEGDSLYGAIDLVGDEAIRLAGTTDVSIYSPAEYVDGKGNRYERPILHVALCTDPVVPGLGGFVPIQSSQGTQKTTANVPVLRLQEATMPDAATPNPNGQPTGAGDPSTAIVEAITEKVMTLVKDTTKTAQEKKAAFGDLMKKLEKALGVFEPDAAAEWSVEVENDAPPIGASRGPASPDPFVLKLARENYRGKLDALVAAGKITPIVRDRLAAQYLSDKALSLSLSAKDTDQLDGLLAALAENASVLQVGERTGQQTLALSRSIPSGEDLAKNREEAGKELRRMTAAAAGMKTT